MSLLHRAVSLTRKSFTDDNQWLDLAYITPQLVVTSMPTTDYWRSYYRTPAHELVNYLDARHDDSWWVWNLQEADESGYEDEVFRHKVTRHPIPDHAPPRFVDLLATIEQISRHVGASGANVAVIHCKAGKGRSGTIATAFLQSHHNMPYDIASRQFTRSRMRSFFGAGVSIPSQQRYLQYVERWKALDKPDLEATSDLYVEIKSIIIRGPKYPKIVVDVDKSTLHSSSVDNHSWDVVSKPSGTGAVLIYYPVNGPVLSSVDSRITIHRSQRMNGIDVVHGGASLWFNAFIETIGQVAAVRADGTPFGPWNATQNGDTGEAETSNSGFFSCSWSQLDGAFGTHLKGTALFDSIEVYWKLATLVVEDTVPILP